MKILIVSGGTGGHLFPAIRLAEEIALQDLGQFMFIASCRRQDRDILTQKNIKFRTIGVIGFQPEDIFSIFNFTFRLIAGTIKSLFLLLQFRPDVVVGFGGYASGPILLLAAFLRKKTMIHEQNVYPGKTNRILARFVGRIAVGFPGTTEYLKRFKSKVIVSGNPLRRGLKRFYRREGAFRVLTMGGSQGARIFNRVVPEALGLIPDDKKTSLEVIHISGDSEKDAVERSYQDKGIRNRVFGFRFDIDSLYNESDFVIARAGALTVSELLYLAMPAILIPYPHRDFHQLLNARVLEKVGTAVILQEKDLSASVLRDAIIKFMDRGMLAKMSQKVRNDNKDACSILVNEIFKLADKRTRRNRGRSPIFLIV